MAGFRDRFFTPQTARAITSPAAVLTAAVGASAGILLGAPLVAAAVVGLAAHAGVVALKMPRSPRQERVDPRQLREPWRRFVAEALDAQRRFEGAVRTARSGPLRDRLHELAERIEVAVRESWRIARHGEELELAMKQLEPLNVVASRLASVEADLAGERRGDERLEQTAAALRSQIASSERIGNVIRDTRDRLRLLDARLDESVARAVELSLQAGDGGDLGGLTSDVEVLVSEMESLRQALEETRAVPQI